MNDEASQWRSITENVLTKPSKLNMASPSSISSGLKLKELIRGRNSIKNRTLDKMKKVQLKNRKKLNLTPDEQEKKEIHLNKTFYDPQEKVKREAVDLVDELHKSENGKLKEGIKYIGEDIHKWDCMLFQPFNFDTALYRKTLEEKEEKIKREDPTNPV